MGFRFSKSKSFGKIFRVTVSKGGVSASVGVPGYRKTLTKRGVTTTLSIPHTGLSHTTTVKHQPPKQVVHGSSQTLAQPIKQILVQPTAPPTRAILPTKSASGSKVALFLGLAICAYLLLNMF
jgi:hypothetical protein